MEHPRSPTRNARSDGKKDVRLVVELTTPTGQQQEKVADGLRLVLEFLARRYRREHGHPDPEKMSRESP